MRPPHVEHRTRVAPWLALVTLLSPAIATAGSVPAFRCVPVRVSPCLSQNVYPNWASAYAAANAGDTVILAEGMPPARLRVGKRLIVKSVGDFVHSDAGLEVDPDTYVVHVAPGGESSDLRVKVRVTADRSGVPRSAGAIFLEVDSDVLQGSSVFGPGKGTETIGIRVNRGTGSKTMRVLGSSAEPVRVVGFGVGIFVDNPAFHVTSYVEAVGNGTGLFQRWGRGQNFYGVWRDNDVGIEMQAVHGNDTNDHEFTCNGVALRSSQSCANGPGARAPACVPNPTTGRIVNGPHLEYNFHVVETCGGVDVEVEVSPGVFVADRDLPPRHKGARTLDPGGYIQYSSRVVDGVQLPTWKTGAFDD